MFHKREYTNENNDKSIGGLDEEFRDAEAAVDSNELLKYSDVRNCTTRIKCTRCLRIC